MSVIQITDHSDSIEEISPFFAPMNADLVDGLVGQYNVARGNIEALAEAVRSGQNASVLHYFVDGNVKEQSHSIPNTVDALFRAEGAIAQLNADFWNRALRMTDVLDYMPQARRDEWFEQIRNPEGRKANSHTGEKGIEALPDFEETSVRLSLTNLLHSRAQFFSERVDGIFQALSREHVTNCPQGFNRRMILLGAITSYGTVDYRTAGVVNDLRCVIAKFMGRDEPKHSATDPVINAARKNNGVWMSVDGNALRIRIYNGVGTAHIEVHPDIAWRLNAVLANLYPLAIPAEFRTKPKRAKKIKDFELFDKPLPFAVIDLLASLEPAKRNVEIDHRNYRENIPCTRKLQYGQHDKALMAQAEQVLESIGAVREKSGNNEYWRFDYEPGDVLDEVVCSGRIPDNKSHQFYPTPKNVAEKAIELLQADDSHVCLEPSAGQGGLADLMPDGTICVEISNLHCKILEAKGHFVMQADFIKMPQNRLYDRICMNPPFSEGRWQAHLEHAADMLADDGRLVAILPASAKGKQLLEGFDHHYSPVFENQFVGTSVAVVLLLAKRSHPV